MTLKEHGSFSVLCVMAVWLSALTASMSLHFVLVPLLLKDTGYSSTFSPVVVQHADAVFNHIPVVSKLRGGLPAWGDQFVDLGSRPTLDVWPRLPYYVLALPAWAVAARLEALALVAVVLFTPLNAALLYRFIFRLVRSGWVAVVGTTIVLGFSELFVLQPWHWIRAGQDMLATPIFFNALVNPQLSFMLLCAALLGLLSLLTDPKPHTLIVNGFVFGLSFYTYSFLWTYLVVLYCVHGAFLLARRRFAALRALAWVVALGMVIAIPYLTGVLQFRLEPGFVDFQDRFALGRRPGVAERVAHLRPHLLTVVGLAVALAERKRRYTFLFLSVLTVEIVWKLPVIIGYDFQTLHYAYFAYAPLAGIVLILAINYLLQGRRYSRALGPAVVVGLTLGALGLIAYRSTAYSIKHYMAFAIPEGVQQAYDYIRTHAAPGTIILAADPEVNMRVRSVAPVYVYVPSGWGTIVSTDEMLTRATEAWHVFGIEPDDAFEYDLFSTRFPVAPNYKLVSPETYLFAMSLQFPSPERRRAAIQEAYRYRAAGHLTYQADVIWVGAYERALGRPSFESLPGVVEILRNDEVSLYRVNQHATLSWR